MLIFDQLKKNDPQLRLLALMILAGLFVLFAGLWWVQIVGAGKYQMSQEEQSFITVRMPATRGKIFDRNEVALAENRPVYNLNLYIEQLRRDFQKEFKKIQPRTIRTNDLPFWKDWLGYSTISTQAVKLTNVQSAMLERTARYRVVNGIAARAGEIMRTPLAVDYTNFSRHYDDKSRALPYTIASNLTSAQVTCYAEQATSLPAVQLEIQALRYYPYGNTAAAVLGYVVRSSDSVSNELSYYDYRPQDFIGKVGIEGRYDMDLRGAAGQKIVVVNNMRYRQAENTVVPVEPGKNIHLTIDLKVQQAAEKSLQTHAGSGGKGAVVVMDVWSGDVYALVSLPTMDPNVSTRWKTNTPENARWMDENVGLQKNRATAERYQAGSIFKIIVALAALETPQARFDPNEKFRVTPNPHNPARGGYFVGKQLFKDTVKPDDYDLVEALAESSNSYFIALGLRPGVFERVVELGRRLHLGERMKFGDLTLPLRQESAGIFPTPEQIRKSDWRDGHSANICIGQGGMAVTPMQMAVMTAALANGGKVLMPRMVSRIETQDITSGEPPILIGSGNVRDTLNVSARSLKIVHNAMRAETEKPGGTGYDAFNSYYQNGGTMRVCGKTGTAELDVRGPDNRLKNTTWFASFAPFERPRFAVVVMVENGQTGGKTCAPVARDVYMALEKMGPPAGPNQTASTR